MNPAQELGKQAATWAEYGLAGLVILALFLLVFWLVHANGKERAETRDAHSSERKEWHASSAQQAERLEKAFEKVSDAIQKRTI